MGINQLFTPKCDLTSIANSKLMCNGVEQSAKLVVNSSGLKATARVILYGFYTCSEPDVFEYLEFVVDRGFAYVITDNDGTVLFTGIKNNL